MGATNLILMPETSNHLSTLTFLSPDGKSKAFDASGKQAPVLRSHPPMSAEAVKMLP